MSHGNPFVITVNIQPCPQDYAYNDSVKSSTDSKINCGKGTQCLHLSETGFHRKTWVTTVRRAWIAQSCSLFWGVFAKTVFCRVKTHGRPESETSKDPIYSLLGASLKRVSKVNVIEEFVQSFLMFLSTKNIKKAKY